MGPESEDIQVLTGLEAIRRRPSLYIGDVAEPAALTILVENVLCASVDEAYAGECQLVSLTLHADGSVTASDDGPGMSVELDPKFGKPRAEVLLTTLFACRAFRKEEKVAQRFCGAGIAVVNALSEWLELRIRRAGHLYAQRYRRGVPDAALRDEGPSSTTGTTIKFRPDPEVFARLVFDVPAIRSMFSEISTLAPRVRTDLFVEAS